MNLLHSTRRTDPQLEFLVVSRIAEGVRYIDISEETAVPVSTIKKIRKRNEVLLVEIKKQNIKKEAAIIVSNLQKSRQLLAQRLDQALANQEHISIKDLVSISKEMHHQFQVESAMPNALINQEESAELTGLLLKAIKADDYVAMTGLVFDKNSVRRLT